MTLLDTELRINANQYNATTQAVSDALLESKNRGERVTVEATGQRREAIESELYEACDNFNGPSRDGSLTYSGRDAHGTAWTIRLV